MKGKTLNLSDLDSAQLAQLRLATIPAQQLSSVKAFEKYSSLHNYQDYFYSGLLIIINIIAYIITKT